MLRYSWTYTHTVTQRKKKNIKNVKKETSKNHEHHSMQHVSTVYGSEKRKEKKKTSSCFVFSLNELGYIKEISSEISSLAWKTFSFFVSRLRTCKKFFISLLLLLPHTHTFFSFFFFIASLHWNNKIVMFSYATSIKTYVHEKKRD